jgi:hypothetical protein
MPKNKKKRIRKLLGGDKVPLFSFIEDASPLEVLPSRNLATEAGSLPGAGVAIDERGRDVTAGPLVGDHAFQGVLTGRADADFARNNRLSTPLNMALLPGAMHDPDKLAQTDIGDQRRFPPATDERGNPVGRSLELVPERITEKNTRIPMGIFGTDIDPAVRRKQPKTRRGRMIESLISEENRKRISEGARFTHELIPMVRRERLPEEFDKRGPLVGPDDFVVKGKI